MRLCGGARTGALGCAGLRALVADCGRGGAEDWQRMPVKSTALGAARTRAPGCARWLRTAAEGVPGLAAHASEADGVGCGALVARRGGGVSWTRLAAHASEADCAWRGAWRKAQPPSVQG